ncbi:MAG: hemolysin [Thermoleophilia bacterium]|nr:hemolysin [Thermoleophilia bacterium]
MDPIAINLIVIAVLVLVNAAFAGTEMAVVSLRRSQIQRMALDEGRRGRTLLALSEEPSRFLSTIQLAITLAGFLASAAAAVSLADPLEPVFAWAGDAAGGLSLVVVTLALTFVTLVFGELVPKRIAMRHSERWALLAALPVAFLAKAATPIVWLLAKCTDVFASMLGGGGVDEEDLLTDQEVLDVIATETAITKDRQAMVEGVLELETRMLREVLVPRRDVLALDADMPASEAALKLAHAGRSRAPVAEGSDLDHVVGTVALPRLVAAIEPSTPVRDLARPAVVMPDNAHVQDALKVLQSQRVQLAIVADEHGRTIGIVTVEDLLEEIVGELYDEYDRDLSPSDPRGYQRQPDGSFIVPGTFPVHDLEDIGFEPPEETDAATVGGLLMDALGAVPAPGELAQFEGFTVTAVKVTGNVIGTVQLTRT